MSELTVTDFVLARIEHWDQHSVCAGSGEYSSCDEQADLNGNVIDAMRKIVKDAQRNPHAPWDAYQIGRSDLSGSVLRALASIWADHPDWREEWRA